MLHRPDEHDHPQSRRRVYRELKARAARSGRTIGEAINEAVRFYLAVPSPYDRRGSLFDLEPETYPQGSERLSEEIDQVVYGIDR